MSRVFWCLVLVGMMTSFVFDVRALTLFGKQISYPEVSIEFRHGVAFIENATKSSLDNALLFGMGVDVGFQVHPRHLLFLTTGYLRPLNKEDKGSKQVRVKSSMQLIDIIFTYRYRFPVVSIAGGIGPSLSIVSTTTQLYDLGNPTMPRFDRSEIYTDSIDEIQYQFPDRTLVDESKERGVNAGMAVCIGGTIDIGTLLNIEENFFLFHIASQYVRRDERNEIYTWATLAVAPIALLEN